MRTISEVFNFVS